MLFRSNVYAHWDAPVVTFSTHMDTVPPFFPSREDDEFIWGRGACDTKGIIAAMLLAVEALVAQGERRVALLFVVGEERNSAGATAASKDNRGSKFLVNGEPTECKLVLGSKGALRYEVIATGKVTSYPLKSSYQIVIESLEPAGVGALLAQLDERRRRLEAEGLFDPKHKKALPTLPSRIGLVTSPTGAAVQDMLNVLNRRFSNRHIFILPTSVQGDKAAPEIVSALQNAEEWNQTHPERAIEVLIVGREIGRAHV